MNQKFIKFIYFGIKTNFHNAHISGYLFHYVGVGEGGGRVLRFAGLKLNNAEQSTLVLKFKQLCALEFDSPFQILYNRLILF